MDTLPKADVIWWNATSYFIKCPFCEEIHRHGINWKGHKVRYSHCERMKEYLCCFPMNDEGEVAYEIDKKRGRYTNICVPHDGDDERDSDVDHLALELVLKAKATAQRRQRRIILHEDSKEVIVKDRGDHAESFEMKRILEAMADCVQGDVKAVQKYLHAAIEGQIFIQGEDHDGKTTLIMAAAGQSSEMVLLLIKNGADVDAKDRNGRTALMEAALFGWVDNVKVLLTHNADKKIRDDDNRLAIDFAQDHNKNRREIYARSGGDLAHSSSSRPRLGYIEDTFSRDIDRKEIVQLLGGDTRSSSIVLERPPTLSLPNSYSFKPSRSFGQDSLVLCGPIEQYPITKSWKTVAHLERGGKFPSIGAMSGWSHCSAQSLRVDGRQWTDEVFYISEKVGHYLTPSSWDHEKAGQFNACHAEKQLIAYFIDRHVFLPRDSVPDVDWRRKFN
ncbi:hypothetical protein N7509_008058 [Penicillium cosmopolitanum]|uniref:Single-strand DNA deaminase toxin A-like C-terminal domain-containing protein n=1 Tax=Penicillium cosmopolitanum TaxID=1131564 RepID=A0A9W9W016_9EURO|nr:uncharacterized protein N7509_008058 [Penicillium cosmopolitanum]KAJ5392568.1 hypothetical protein N7509_008058 [Penicillium cosmopolitanum]